MRFYAFNVTYSRDHLHLPDDYRHVVVVANSPFEARLIATQIVACDPDAIPLSAYRTDI